MVKISSKKLESGMVVAQAIETKRGQIIAVEGTVLSPQLIARLSFYNIENVMVTDETASNTKEEKVITEDISQLLSDLDEEEVQSITIPSVEIKKPAEDKTKSVNPAHTSSHIESMSFSSKIQVSPRFQKYQMSFTNSMVSLKDYFDQIISGDVDEDLEQHMLKVPSELFASKTSLEIFDMVHNMRSVDDTIYAHSLNVALIARAIGKWLKYSREDLDLLTIAGLLHDIGKTQVPEEILNKQGKLTDDEFALIKSHPLAGYKILKNTKFDTRIKLAALQHHERFDGSGYPRGLEGDEIDEFASIIALADVYDAMTAARSYRSPKCAFQVIYEFEQEGFQKYNPEVIYTFLKRVANCYSNSRVLLSDGRSGQVVFLNKNALSRPIVKLDDGEMVDLSTPDNHDIFIKSIL
ncbi:MAG: HD-GYP domain-containing protein [Lachnospiraceae bacterium]|nr:HD-GYP domain-containing protein [Lachnospiraceae bacterium]